MLLEMLHETHWKSFQLVVHSRFQPVYILVGGAGYSVLRLDRERRGRSSFTRSDLDEAADGVYSPPQAVLRGA